MANPWLAVPLSDYEQHMGPDHARQLAPLSELFAEALQFCRPKSVAILGIAGGNGLEHVDCSVTKRICAVDINPQYLDIVSKRFGHLSRLELHCLDLAAIDTEHCLAPVDLCHAALIFEHAGLDKCLNNAVSMVSQAGHFSVVLQLSSAIKQGISTEALPSIQSLRDHFSLIDPKQFRGLPALKDFEPMFERTRSLPGGKSFWLGVFKRVAQPGI